MKITARRINTLLTVDLEFNSIEEARIKNPGYENFREVSSN